VSTSDGWIHKDTIRRYVLYVEFPDSEPLWILSTEPAAAELAEAARREPEAIRPPEIVTLLRSAIPKLQGKLTSEDPDLQLLVDILNVLRVTRPATPNPHALGRDRIRRVSADFDELAAELPRMIHQARQSLIASVYTGQPCTIDAGGLAALAQFLADLPAAKAVFVAAKVDPRLAIGMRSRSSWHGIWTASVHIVGLKAFLWGTEDPSRR
jgi:hypothetical protein